MHKNEWVIIITRSFYVYITRPPTGGKKPNKKPLKDRGVTDKAEGQSRTNPSVSLSITSPPQLKCDKKISGNWTYGKGFDTPNENILLGNVFDASDGCLELGRVGVRWNGNNDFNVVGSGPALELRPGFDHVLDARMGMPFNYRFDPNEGLHLFRIKTSKGLHSTQVFTWLCIGWKTYVSV